MLYICDLLIFFDIVTKRRKIQTRECGKTPLLSLDDSISPNNERNDSISPSNEINDTQETFNSLEEEVQHEEHCMPICL